MAHFIFKEGNHQMVSYVSHTGDIDFDLNEVEMNTVCIEDMIVYLYVDAYQEDVDYVFGELYEEEHDYDTSWFESMLSVRGITFEVIDGTE